MDKVAGNLLNNVIEFFGILLPGVIFAYLHTALLSAMLIPNASAENGLIQADWSWILVFIQRTHQESLSLVVECKANVQTRVYHFE